MGGLKLGLKGLSANDRTPEDQREIQQINSMGSGQMLDSIDINPPMPITVRDTASFGEQQMFLDQYFNMLDDKVRERKPKDEAYYNSINRMRDVTHSGENVVSKYTTDIQNIAQEVSPYYRRFRFTDRLTVDTPQWNELAAQYISMYDAYGEDAANQYLDKAIKYNVASNQPLWEKGWYAFIGMGTDTLGSLISTAGMFSGLFNATIGNYEKNENLNGFENFMNEVLDNKVTRFGNDIVTYGTFMNLDEAKAEGIPYSEILSTEEQEKQFLNTNTPFEVIQQGGFTLASIIAGAGYSKIANWGFRGMKGAALANSANDLQKAKNAITRIQKFENFNNRVVIPGLVGTTEGVVEGLQTKIGIQEEGYKNAYDIYNQAVRDVVNQELSNYTMTEVPGAMPKYFDKDGNEVNLNALYLSAQEKLQPKLEESLQQVDYAASKAGVGNFMVNSAINGFLNVTFKAGLQSETVQNSLRNGKLTGRFMPKGYFQVTENAGKVRVKPKVSTPGMVWSYLKEPIGEFGEEYAQTLSDSFFTGFADANIHSFIENKYNGNAAVAVGSQFSDDWASAWTQLEHNLVSRESMKAGVYGALSSMLGTPGLSKRTNKLDANGRVVYRTDSQGNIVRDKKGNPVVEKTLFGRGQSADGDLETRWEALQRWVPWRSGLTANVRETRRRRDASFEQAQALEEWLNDPNNIGKFDGLTGTISWMDAMNNSGNIGDEYNYRNSALGKAVNDIFMLQKAEGSELYNSIVSQLTEIAYMEKGSDASNQYIQSTRDNVNIDTDSMTDEEIFSHLQNNARKTLEMMSQVKEETSNLEKLLGDIDEDTKQSLVFAQMSLNDWEARSKQLKEELAAIQTEPTVEHSTNLSNKQKSIIAQYGSIEKARDTQAKLQDRIDRLGESITGLEKRKSNLTNQEEVKLKELRVVKRSLEKQLSALGELSSISEEASTVLNEEEIMALDPVTRAQMILQGKSKLYNQLYQGEQEAQSSPYSSEQQAVIDHLVEQGMAQDRDFLAKVVDAGRIANATTRFLNQYNAALLDQRGYKAYAANVKQQAADALTRSKADEIGSIQDYTEFAAALDNAFETSDIRGRRVLARSLESNPNYQKYKTQKQTIDRMMRVVGTNEKFRELDGNTADLFMNAVVYMSENGIDLNSNQAVWDALTATDANGYNKFVSYLNQQNQGLDPAEQTVFTSLEEVYQTYKDIWTQAEQDRLTQERAKEPVQVTPNSTQPAPAAPPTPASQAEEAASQSSTRPGIFGKASTTAEGGFTAEERAGQPLEVEQGNPNEQPLQDQAIETPKIEEQKSSQADAMIKTVQNSANYSQESRAKAEAILNELKSQEFIDEDSFQQAVINEAVKLEANGDETSMLSASLLRRAVGSNAVAQSASVFGNRRVYQNRRTNPNAAVMQTVEMPYIREHYPNSPIVKYYDRYHIDSFLSEGKITGDTPTCFLTDEAFTQEVQTYMQEEGIPYNETQLPIIAVVEDENGPYIVGDKKYQPIGIMPADYKNGYNGSARMPRIRKLANSDGVQLIQYNGKPLETRPNGKGGGVRATPKDENQRQNTGIQAIMEQDMSQSEREETSNLSKKDKRSHPAYQRIKSKFLKHLGVGTLPSGHKMVAYMQPNMKDGKANPIFVFAAPIETTQGRDTEKTLPEVVSEGNTDEIINFNSRTRGVLRTIENFLNGMPSTQGADSDVISQIQGSAASLQNAINRFLYLSPRSGFKYSIVPISGQEGIIDGERLFSIELSNDETGEKIQLATFHKNSNAKEVAKDIIGHLLMNGGSLRTAGGKPLISWQVDYKEVESGSKEAASNMSDWVDDGILELPATSLEYEISHVDINSPFKNDGTLVYTPTEANPDNATSPTAMNNPVVGVEQANAGDAIVDGDTGAVLEGNVEQPANEPIKVAEERVKVITEDSKLFELSEDGKSYVNTKTGRVYTRVTSILSADVTASERFDQNSAWALPSTSIGTSVDEFVRDFFAGTLRDSYPNASTEQWESFRKQLEGVQMQMEAMGMHIVPRDIVAAGTLEITDSEGKKYSIDVAGTLDLLAYDSQGNFYIFDMKTVRNPNSIEGKKHKWSQQTSLYQKFLENAYGIKIKNRYVIPIQVSYPDPRNVEYTQGEGTQLMMGDSEFRGANPTLMHIVSLDLYEPNIDYSKLTDQERELAKGIAEVAQNGGTTTSDQMQGTPETATVAQSDEPYIDPTTGLAMDQGDAFGNIWHDPMLDGFTPDLSSKMAIMPAEMRWENLTNEQRATLEHLGFSEESYNQIDTQEEVDHIRECLGF